MKKQSISVLVSTLFALGLIYSADLAHSKSAGWTTTTNDTGAAAADCSNCDEEISVLISCTRQSAEREIHLMLVEQRDDGLAGEKALVRLKSGKKILALSGTYSQPGMIGPYPVLTVSQRDKAFELLANADKIEVTAGSTKQTVSMKGFRTAFKKLQAACR